MANEINLGLHLNSYHVPASNKARLIYLLVDVIPGEQIIQSSMKQGKRIRRKGVVLNLCLAVDKSYSMYIPTPNLEQQKKLLEMNPDLPNYAAHQSKVDGMDVLTFDNLPDDVKERLQDLLASCAKNMDFVKKAVQSAVAELSETDTFSMVAFATEGKVLIPSQSGSRRENVPAILNEMDSADLGDETNLVQGITLGIQELRKNTKKDALNRLILITDGIVMDPDESKSLAEKVSASDISITTIGVGSQFNEDLLISIAENSNGNFYYVRKSEDIPEVYAKELREVESTVARNLLLRLNFIQGVELYGVYRVKPYISTIEDIMSIDRSLNVSLGDMTSTSPQGVLLELVVPPRKPGTYRIAQVLLTYDLPEQNLLTEQVRSDVTVQVSSDAKLAEAQSPIVMDIVKRVNVFKLRTRALDEAATGDVQGATKKLKTAATILLDLGEDELANKIDGETEKLKRQGQLSPDGSKELKDRTRKLTRE